MKTTKESLKDLEVLKEYLSEEELKDVAKQVAYETFRNSIGSGNVHSKENIEFYIKYGAYEAVVKHAKENQLEDIAELSKQLNTRVARIISSLQSYQIPYEGMLKEAVEANKETVLRKVESVLKDAVENEEAYNSVYRLINDCIGEYLGDRLMTHLKESFVPKS